MIRLLTAALVLLAGGCAASGTGPGHLSAEDDGPAAFERLEEWLLDGPDLRITATITSKGAVESDFRGTWQILEDDHVHIEAQGAFAGEPLLLSVLSGPERLSGINRGRTFSVALPPALNEGLILGLTRMGLLHNVAVMSAGSPPDGTDGGARDWVRTQGHTLSSTQLHEGRPGRALWFEIEVGGQPAGEATLWLDPDTGLPFERIQTVRFPEGSMEVVERYESWT